MTQPFIKILLAGVFIFFSILLHAQDKVQLIKKGEFYGLGKENGKEIIEAVYDTIIPGNLILNNEEADGFYYVQKGKKYGLYTSSGVKILDANYDTIYPINNCVIGVKNNKKLLFSLTGTCLPACNYVLQYSDYGYIFSKDKKYFLYDYYMRFFVSLDSVSETLPLPVLQDSIAMRDNPMIRKYPAMRSIGLSRFITFDGEKYGIYDYQNREIFTPQFTDVRLSDDINRHGAEYLLANKDSLCYIIDTTGKIIYKSKYNQMEYFPLQACIIINLYTQNGDEFIIVKPDGTPIIKDTFSAISPAFGSQFIATYPSGWKNLPEQQKTVFNAKGKIIIPAAYEEISIQESNEYYAVTKYNYNEEFGVTESRVGLIDTSGKILIPCYYNSIEVQNAEYAKVTMEVKNYHKYINKNRQFKSDYLLGLVSFKGKVFFLTDAYEEFGEFHEGLSIAKLNPAYAEKGNNEENNSEKGNETIEREFFYINMKGKRYGKAAFDYCTDFENGIALVMNYNNEPDSITGEETATIDVIDKKSTWFSNPKKAAKTRKTSFSASLSNKLVRAISKNFVLFDTDDSCTVIRRNEKGNFTQENYQAYQVLPYDPSPIWPYFVMFSPVQDVPVLPYGFALMKNNKYALFDEDGKACSGFIIDAVDVTEGIKIVIGEESGSINEYFEVIKWEGKHPPVFRRNKLSKQKLSIKPKPIKELPFYFHYN